MVLELVKLENIMESDLIHQPATFSQWMYEAKRLMLFNGAGIITKLGLHDFLRPDGIWIIQAKRLLKGSPNFSIVEPDFGLLAIVKIYKLCNLAFLILQNVETLHIRSEICCNS
jgi:hypothetical protein